MHPHGEGRSARSAETLHRQFAEFSVAPSSTAAVLVVCLITSKKVPELLFLKCSSLFLFF